jgi:hypothetical protein
VEVAVTVVEPWLLAQTVKPARRRMTSKWLRWDAIALYITLFIFLFAGLVLSPEFIISNNSGSQGIATINEKITIGSSQVAFPILVSVGSNSTAKVKTMTPVEVGLLAVFNTQGNLSRYLRITQATIEIDNAVFAGGTKAGASADIPLTISLNEQGNWYGSAVSRVEYTAAGSWSGKLTFSGTPPKGGTSKSWSSSLVIPSYHVSWSADLRNFTDVWGYTLIVWGVGFAALGYGIYAINRRSRRLPSRRT